MLPNPPQIAWSSSALFLDVDGTLLEIVDRPESVRADATLIGDLQAAAARLNGALALISGRTIGELNRIFAPAIFIASGTHGMECQDSDGQLRVKEAAGLPGAVIDELESFAAQHEGVLLERKGVGAALHYRLAPRSEAAARALLATVAAYVHDDFRLVEGKMVLELSPHTTNKGLAVEELLAQSPFAGRTPVFVGDDVTDEDGFGAVNRRSGVSVRVGETGDRKTDAQYMLRDVAAVRQWLSAN